MLNYKTIQTPIEPAITRVGVRCELLGFVVISSFFTLFLCVARGTARKTAFGFRVRFSPNDAVDPSFGGLQNM